jgi:N-acetylneuraminate synthase
MTNNNKHNFNDLFVFDLANNHQGDLDHAINIIDQFSLIVKKKNIRAAIKFQFRNLKTFIHPNYKNNKKIKHINRFESTELKFSDYEKLVKKIKDNGLITMSTPFDEESIKLMERLEIDILKIASCSFNDFPLIQSILKTKFPIIASTGGSSLNQIDNFVTVFENQKKDFAINHCIPIYPTPKNKLELNQIDNLKKRYPNLTVGWSTHEDPNDILTVKLAYAKGARMFERHIGINNERYKLNGYSSDPEQTEKWIDAYFEAKESCGSQNRPPVSLEEKESLGSLFRGVYAKKVIKKGEKLTKENVFFAMPLLDGKLSSNDWRSDLKAYTDLEENEAVEIDYKNKKNNQSVTSILVQTNGLLREAGIKISNEWEYEISHHYGLERFREFGAILIDIINRDYCKKLIVQLPRQKHPYHHHKKKEETFHILHGDLEIEKNGNPIPLKAGDIFLVKPMEWHKFSTVNGVVFEEISTTHYKNDSFYEDENINKAGLEKRKTKIKFKDLI